MNAKTTASRRPTRASRRTPAAALLALSAAAAVAAAACSEKRAATDTARAAQTGHPVDTLRRELIAGLGLRPGMVLVDVGCGTGCFVDHAAPVLGKGGRIYATDIDAQAVTAVRERFSRLPPEQFARVEARLCKSPRDTAVDDLASGTVDVILMIDSLCFPSPAPRPDDVAYLARFQRLLRPGGRLVHHMDCRCDTTVDAATRLFAAAGFKLSSHVIPLSPAPTEPVPEFECKTAAAKKMHQWVGVFEKR